jgi:hypothetical protein
VSTAGATGPAPTEGKNYRAAMAKPTDRQKTPTELEMEGGREQGERHARRLFGPPKKPNGTAPGIAFSLDPTLGAGNEPVDTGITAAVTAKQPQVEGIKREMPPGSPEPKIVPQVAVPASNVVDNSTPAEQHSEQQPGPNAGQAKQSSGDGRETTNDEIARFIARVVPWPENPEAAGYINLHWTFWDGEEPPKNPPWGGIPTKTVEDFMKALDWVRAQKNTRDIYFCLSLQSQTRLNKRGRTTAARSKENTLGLKAIWLDIDVKEPPRGYATLRDAVDALTAFCKSMTLPPPSALVLSGGGLHVYWISDKSLTPAEWKPYAEGLKAAVIKFALKCDAGCTVNSACVLRVPGTFNYKKYPRRPVLLEPK